MSKFLKIFAPAGAGVASILTMAYFLADQFVIDLPAPLREAVAVQPAAAQEVPQAVNAVSVDEVTNVVTASVDISTAQAPSRSGGYGIGREALSVEIAAWDTDVRPDGLGLPEGSGDVFTGEEVFVEKCAVCHGDFGEAVGRWPVLAGGHNTLANKDPVKTIGSYWPYLSTVFDYVQRAMPFGAAATLTPDEVYAITAYLLYVNDQVDEDFELSKANFASIRLPNESGFFPDDRLETEFPVFSGEVCMENCKDSVEITMRASVLDVTPEETAAKAEAEAEAAAEQAEAAATPVEETGEIEIASADMLDPALVEAGAGVFRKCAGCHQVGEGATNRVGPELNSLIGRVVGGVSGFNYSGTFKDAAENGEVWTAESLAEFLANPRQARSGTRMSFAGLRKQSDIDAVLAYLQSEGN